MTTFQSRSWSTTTRGSAGVDIQIDLLHRLAELDRVDCIKESTGDVRRISMIREQLGDRLGHLLRLGRHGL